MASSPGTPTTSAPFELSKLLKTPTTNTTTTTTATTTSSPPTPPPSASSAASPPPLSSAGPFSYAPATPPILHHLHPFLHRPAATPNPNPNPIPGARITQHLHAASPIESAVSQPPPFPLNPSTPPPPAPSPARVLSGKKPRGRRLGGGERAVHDVDWRMQGEAEPPQLEVTPITKYTSDPDLVLGRQIAVNRSYIVYGLKLGNIRVLNINTALRSLLRGHTQRVTDMAFFAEDVQLLASASADGRVFIWKIDEGPDKENKPQITAKIVTAIQIVGDGESYHPRICWHSHKQEILFVGIGSIVLKIDTIKVGRGKGFSAEEPLKCPIEKLIDGVQLIGKHDGDVTDLSISQWMTTRLASASKDGTVKIWDERKAVALSTLRPHDGQAVNSVAFLTSPDRPDHINLVTAGPLSREVKIWASTSDEGWLLPSDSESWRCNQTLELRSTSESQLEEAFFNQVVILPRTSLLILANAKKNAIYAIHIDYSPCPASTRMDYIADFTVAMPILSLTANSDCLDGEQVVQLYCVQTMAIQQYALDLALCLPPPIDNAGIKRDPSYSHISNKSNSGVAEPSLGSPLLKPSPIDCSNEKTITSTLSADASATEITTSPVPLLFGPSGRLPSLKSSSQGSEQGQSLGDHDTLITSASDVSSVNNKSGKDETSAGQNQTDTSFVPATHVMFKVGGNTTHLVTPSEILSGAISSSEDNHVNQGLKCEEEKIQGVVADNNNERAGVEVKVVEKSRSNENLELDGRKIPEVLQEENNEKLPKSLESNSQMANRGPLLTDTHRVEESRFAEDSAISESLEHSSVTGWEADKDSSKDMPEKFEESAVATASDLLLFDKEEQKVKKSQVPSTQSPSSSPYNSTDSVNEPGNREIVFLSDVALPQISAVQDALNQLITMQKDMQMKLSDMVAVPVAKEGKRIEAALGRSMEKSVKANFDALWARFQEENAKREKIEKDRLQHIANVITNCINKDLPSLLERALKKEISALGPIVARALTPVIEKAISSAVADSFQRGVVDKAVNQLDKSLNSKLEVSLTRQIQTQFQTSGKQALQDALKSSLESSVIPAFEQACKSTFEQIDAAFRKGMSERATAAQQQLEAAHTPLAIALRDAINSASSITQSFTAELVDGQRKLLALVAAGNTKALNPIAVQTNNGLIAARPEMAETPLDPKRELSRLISEHKYEEAFMSALQRSDVSIVSWLCSQVDLRKICSTVPLCLNQGVLLALLQQLACDIANDTSRKVAWMTDVAVAINPSDPMISLHVRPIFEQVYNILGHQRSLPTVTPAESSNIRLLMHVVNSVLLSCK
ncbi:enhancer of mRNA-decapping protein 4-like [Ananas comosus]|uniref:Enhancer of mRNA-decapping protein 4-like n=1 Tax=Ananas comosus TaxID=4615 RepID=A0A6P5GW72_ANACO|nr:enhancer of mRNA-decapping protein 4-like [Ananas comosus]